jgi:hypothetical protein
MNHKEFSRKGGSSKSLRKSQSSRENIAKAREARAAKLAQKANATIAEVNSK